MKNIFCCVERFDMFEIWDGDLFLFSVDNELEADTYAEQGYQVKELNLS